MITITEKPLTKQKAKQIIDKMLWSYAEPQKETAKPQKKDYRAMLLAVRNWRIKC